MPYVADFDPTGFDWLNTATWPMPDPYEPGQWWYITAPGVIDGAAVDIGDRIYPVGTGRLIGELLLGDGVLGGPVPDPPWETDPARVRWRATTNSAAAWDRPAPPYAGCPLSPRTGWRVVVELLYLADPDARALGQGALGDGVLGSLNGLGAEWTDITPATFGISLTRGGVDDSPYVDVESAQLDLVDLDASWFDFVTSPGTADGVVRYPGVGTPLRVSVLDELGNAYPLFTGRVEEAADDHDRPARTIRFDAIGFVSDLATVTIRFRRNSEPATARLNRLLYLGGWEWGRGTYPPDPVELRRTELDEQANVRTEVDRAAVSSSWSVQTDTRGVIQTSPWPTEPAGAVIEVTDQKGAAGLAASAINYVADTAELLNVVAVSSDAVQGDAELTVATFDVVSVGRFGRSSESLGFPITGLSATEPDLEQLAANALDRFARIVNRTASIEVDNLTDARWTAVLAELDHGRPVRVVRTKPTPLTFDAVVVGVEHRLTRGRWSATINLSTITETL